MFLLQAAQAPVIAQFGDRILTIPKFTMNDVIAWGAAQSEKDTDRATKDMDEMKKREYLAYYPPIPPDLQDLKKRIRTPEGAMEVMKICLAKAKVTIGNSAPMAPLTAEEIEQIIAANGTGPITFLGWKLADLDETALKLAPVKKPVPPEDTEADPLTSGGKTA